MSKQKNLQISIHKIDDRQFFNDIVKENCLHQQENEFVGSALLRFSDRLNDMRLAWSSTDKRFVGCAASCMPDYSCVVFVLPFYRHRGIGKQLIHGMSTDKVDSRKSLKYFFQRS